MRNTHEINKVSWVHFAALLVVNSAFLYALEAHPEHRATIWTAWFVVAALWLLALGITMLIRYRKQRRNRYGN